VRTGAVVLCLLFASHLNAQDQAAQKDTYLALLERYASGDVDGAVTAALRLDVEPTRRIARVLSDPKSRAVTMRRRKLILLLHTEAGLRTAVPQQQLLIAKDVVHQLLESSGDAQDPDLRLFVRDWYLLVVSQLGAIGQLPSLRSHLIEGLARFKDDPELLLARGSLYEQDAEASVVDRSLMRQIYTPPAIARWRLRLYDARDDFRKASRLSPDLAEARLRLGRVQGLLGEAPAAATLGGVASSGAPPFLRYLAYLFRAELSERAGNLPGARNDYESAFGTWPQAQAPKLALSRIAMSSGDAGSARRWLERSLEEADAGRIDPWWDYLQGQAWRGDERLASFRRRGLTP
jgi:hypothetical protein